MRQQAVAAGDVDDAPAAAVPPHSPRHLPRFVQLFSWQAAGTADRARQSIEERVTGETPEVVFSEPIAGTVREGHEVQGVGEPGSTSGAAMIPRSM